jgi:hypothetical protein
MMNFKQKEVLETIITKLHEKFPEVQLVSVEDLGPNSFWVTMIEPTDEDRQMELDQLQAELGTDALMEYGINFHFVPASLEKVAA